MPANEVTTPVALAVSPDGQLVCSSYGRQSVTVWDISEEIPKLLRTITGPEVRDPAGVAFTTQLFEAPAQFGNFVPQPSNTGRDWTPTGTTIYNLRGAHAFVPFRDTNPNCAPDAAYKALGVGGGQHGLYAFKSTDGLHWTLINAEPVITQGAFDSHNLAFWDAQARSTASITATFATDGTFARRRRRTSCTGPSRSF